MNNNESQDWEYVLHAQQEDTQSPLEPYIEKYLDNIDTQENDYEANDQESKPIINEQEELEEPLPEDDGTAWIPSTVHEIKAAIDQPTAVSGVHHPADHAVSSKKIYYGEGFKGTAKFFNPYDGYNSLSTHTSKSKKKLSAAPSGITIETKHPTFKVEEEQKESLPELHYKEARLPVDLENFDILRNSLSMIRVPEQTLVYALVIDTKGEKNVLSKIRCYGGIPFGGYAKNLAEDSYIVECVEYIDLGSIPFGYRVEMVNVGQWRVAVPIPDKILNRSFTPTQRKRLQKLRNSYDSRFTIQYFQMSTCF